MTPVPPTLVRRVVVAPVLLVAEAAVVVASPVLALLAALASPLAGGRRPLRLLAIAVSYAARHLGCTAGCFALWVASGFGRRAGRPRFQAAHYGLMRWFVGGVYRSIVRHARVDVRVSDSETAGAVLSDGSRPVVVLSRHAGEGDSLLILHRLLCTHRRKPRVVLHHALKLDPLIDVLGRRLPNRFVDPRGGDTEVEIADMTRDLEDDGAVLIFPEGANFTPERRRRGIERLERAGHAEEAAWAREMQHVTAPRPGGALAALDAAPHADVVFVGHAGVPVGFGDLWRQLPTEQTVHLRMWHVPAGDLPARQDDRIDWLFGWWRTLDAWVASTAGPR